MGYRCHVTTEYNIKWGDSITSDHEVVANIVKKALETEVFIVAPFEEADKYEFEYATFIEFMEKGDFSKFTDEEIVVLKGIYDEVNGKGDNFGTGWFLVEFF